MIFALNYKKINFKLCETIYKEDGYPIEYYFTLTDDTDKVYTTKENEIYVENEEIRAKINLKDLTKEVNLELSHVVSIKGYVVLDDDIRDTGIIQYTPILQHNIWERNTILNNAADKTQKKSYKKTIPLTQCEEVQRIQEALQRMKINIGKDGIDGKYGNDTKTAIETFQTNYTPTHNLHQYDWADEPDGIVGKNTLLAMDEALVNGWRYKEVKCDCTKKFHKISKIILRHEGGYINDPDDPGGATNKGIAWNTWKAYAKIDINVEPTLENLKKLSDKDAEIIYRKRYWEPKYFCKLKNDKVGLMVYDWTITSGGAAKKIQELLNKEFAQKLTVTRRIDISTIDALNNIDNQQKLLERITEIRKSYYKNLVYKNGKATALKKYLKGWLNRVDDCLGISI